MNMCSIFKGLSQNRVVRMCIFLVYKIRCASSILSARDTYESLSADGSLYYNFLIQESNKVRSDLLK